MRKYIVGALVGLLLSIPFTTFGSALETMVGKRIQVEYPVVVEDEQLGTKAIVLDGTGYVSIKEIAEATGYFTEFKDGQIIVRKKVIKLGEPPLEESQPTPTP